MAAVHSQAFVPTVSGNKKRERINKI